MESRPLFLKTKKAWASQEDSRSRSGRHGSFFFLGDFLTFRIESQGPLYDKSWNFLTNRSKPSVVGFSVFFEGASKMTDWRGNSSTTERHFLRLKEYAIYINLPNISHTNQPFMQVNIPVPWILWECMQLAWVFWEILYGPRWTLHWVWCTEFAFSTSLSGKIQESSSLVPEPQKAENDWQPKMEAWLNQKWTRLCFCSSIFSDTLWIVFKKDGEMLSDGQVDETMKARTYLAESGDVNQKSWLEFGDKFLERVSSDCPFCQA